MPERQSQFHAIDESPGSTGTYTTRKYNTNNLNHYYGRKHYNWQDSPKRIIEKKTLGLMPIPQNGICDHATHTLHEKVVDAAGNVSRGKVLVLKCVECGYQVGRR